MTGIIILAAGQSSRMGTPKQRLPFQGTNLLQHAINTAAGSKAEIIAVVLGHRADVFRPVDIPSNVNIIINKNWQTGMAGSISAGVKKLMELQPQLQNVIIMLCDQPLVTGELLNSLIQKKAATDKGIIACAYSGTIGVPALFGNAYFEHLATMQGDGGAKKMLRQFAGNVALVDFPGGAIDIDTPEDFTRLLNSI